MAWTNVFDLADWDVYIRFNGLSVFPDPNSREFLLAAADLDPAVGTVTIVDGVVVCDLEGLSGACGVEIDVVLMPSGPAPPDSIARVTAESGAVEPVPMVGNEQGLSGRSIASLTNQGCGTYTPVVGAANSTVAIGAPMTQFHFGAVPSGQGVSVLSLYGGL